MHKYSRFLMMISLAVLIGSASYAGKLTSDPNISKVAPSGPIADSAMAKLVSCDKGCNRLAAIVEEISTATGLKIGAGKNADDWESRDVPLTVYVKDVPVGKLLSWIAESAHMVLQSSKIGKDEDEKSKSYRILRDKKCQQELDNDAKAELEWGMWAWDVWTKLGNSSTLVPPTEPGISLFGPTWATMKLIAALGPETKEKIFAGDAVLLYAESSPYASLIENMYKEACKQKPYALSFSTGELQPPTETIHEPTQAEIERAFIDIRLLDGAGLSYISISMPAVDRGSMLQDSTVSVIASPEFLKKYAPETEFPAQPKRLDHQDPVYDCSGSKRHFLVSDEDWKLPILQTVVNFDLPEDNKEITYADMLSMLSKESGFSIVCEDFQSPRPGESGKLDSIVSPSTIGAVLKQMDACWWSIDEGEHVIIGWAKNWRAHARNMVSEKLLANLRTKLTSTGLELDDITPLSNLTPKQCSEWFTHSGDLNMLGSVFLDRTLWQIYDVLTPGDKAFAQSDAGVSLAGLDVEAMKEYLRRTRRYNGAKMSINAAMNEAEKLKYIAGKRFECEAMANPEMLRDAVLMVKRSKASSVAAAPNLAETDINPLSEADRYDYHISLHCQNDGEQFVISSLGPNVAFPVYSKERETELRKAEPQSSPPSTVPASNLIP